MNVLVTGSNGFIGKNLVAELKNIDGITIFEYDRDTGYDFLDKYCQEADFVYHLAGINRSENPQEFTKGNVDFTTLLLEKLKKNENKCPIMISSSIHASMKTEYGKSKRAAEEILINYAEINKIKTFIYRLTNVFGKWSKPNYNSVVATFCYNVARDIPIHIENPNIILELIYIDDLVKDLITLLNEDKSYSNNIMTASKTHNVTLSELSNLIISFKNSRYNGYLPNIVDEFSLKLYSTYLSYVPKENLSYQLRMNIDQRGSFTEFYKTINAGQVSINISKPGYTKGNHWHHTKNEKFLVVYGKGVIRLRQIHDKDVIEFYVNSSKLEVIDIPPGYSHNITNLGETDMVTIMWANEVFNPNDQDTYFLEV